MVVVDKERVDMKIPESTDSRVVKDLSGYKINDENWYKINKILLSEQNKKFLKNCEINEKIIIDFKNLYGHEEGRKFDLNKTLNVIYQILQNLEEKSQSLNNKKLYNPKS